MWVPMLGALVTDLKAEPVAGRYCTLLVCAPRRADAQLALILYLTDCPGMVNQQHERNKKASSRSAVGVD